MSTPSSSSSSSSSTSGGQSTTSQPSLSDKVTEANKWSALNAQTDPRRK